LKREAKGAGLDPNELMGRAVQIGQEKGKPWSESIIKGELKFSENEKTQAALDGIDRVINPQTGYMKQMMDTARSAHLATSGLYNSAELGIRRYFGETTAKTFNTAVTELRRSIAGLIGNPLLGGSETDQKLRQADSLLGEKPTMQNLTDAQTVLTNALSAQKASIIGNNRFLLRRWGPNAQGAQPAAAPPATTQPTAAPPATTQPTAAPPVGATKKVPGANGEMHWTNDQGTVDYGVAPK
jgi:hypothetical protein